MRMREIALQHSEQATAMVMLPGSQLLTVCFARVRHPARAYVYLQYITKQKRLCTCAVEHVCMRSIPLMKYGGNSKWLAYVSEGYQVCSGIAAQPGYIETSLNSITCILFSTSFYSLCVDLRQKFDNGEDPLDPEQNAGGGFNPFGGGGGPFGHGGFTFKFRYN